MRNLDKSYIFSSLKRVSTITLFILLIIYYFHNLAGQSLHLDEYLFVRKAYFYDLFFVKGDRTDPRWEQDSPAQPKVGPYLFGLTLHLSGVEEIDATFDQTGFNDPSQKSKGFWNKWGGSSLLNPTDELNPIAYPIITGRKTSVVFALGALAILFIFCKKLFGNFFAGSATILFGLNTLMHSLGRRAMTDSMQLFSFFVNLLLTFLLIQTLEKSQTKKMVLISVFLGVNLAFGVGVKVSAIMIYIFYIIIVLTLFTFYRFSKKSFIHLLSSFLLTSSVFFVLFVVLHPHLYQDTFSRFLSMFTDRLTDAEFHRLLFPQSAVYNRDTAIELIASRTLFPKADFGNFKFYPLPIDLLLFALGFFLMSKKVVSGFFKSKKVKGELLLVIWTAVVIGSLIFYLKNNWARYFLPTVSVITISQAYAITAIFQTVSAKLKKVSCRIYPPVLPKLFERT